MKNEKCFGQYGTFLKGLEEEERNNKDLKEQQLILIFPGVLFLCLFLYVNRYDVIVICVNPVRIFFIF